MLFLKNEVHNFLLIESLTELMFYYLYEPVATGPKWIRTLKLKSELLFREVNNQFSRWRKPSSLTKMQELKFFGQKYTRSNISSAK